MEAQATSKNIHGSPRKLDLVAKTIREKHYQEATNTLNNLPQKLAKVALKTLQNAVNNWKQKEENKKATEDPVLTILQVYVNSAGMFKRIKPAPQGRAHRIRKRLSHLTIVVDQAPEPTTTKKLKIKN